MTTITTIPTIPTVSANRVTSTRLAPMETTDPCPPPLIGVVIPTHNRCDLLRVALESALAQRDVAVDIVVVDEASHDGTAAMLAEYEGERVRVIRNNRAKGPSAARNAGVAALATEWVAFLDDDDVWAPDLLSSHVEALAGGQRAAWSVSGCVAFNTHEGQVHRLVGHRSLPDGQLAGLDDLLRQQNVVPVTSGVMVRRDVFQTVGGFDASLAVAEDWDLWIRLADHGAPALVDRGLVGYREPASDQSNLSADTLAMAAGRIEVRRRHRRGGDLAARGADADHQRYLARTAMRSGLERRAVHHLIRAVWHSRSAADLVRVAVALVAPHLTARIGRWGAENRIPLPWRAEAWSWLPAAVAGSTDRSVPPDPVLVALPWRPLPGIHRTTTVDAARMVMNRLAVGRGGLIVTPNLHHLWMLVRSPALASSYGEATLIVADGAPLVWASHLCGTPVPERVAGSDLVWFITAMAARSGRRLFLLGGLPGTAVDSAARFAEAFPDIVIAGTSCPIPGFQDDPAQMAALESQLRSAEPDIVLIALGSPNQELLAARLRPLMPATWFVGVGGSFEMASGRVRRAPAWASAVGLEWLYRLVQEPGRLAKRYLVHDIPVGVQLLARSAAGRRFA